VQKTVVAVNAKLLVNQLARQVAASLTKSAKTLRKAKKTKFNLKCRQVKGGVFILQFFVRLKEKLWFTSIS
jgi:hypothetical protein